MTYEPPRAAKIVLRGADQDVSQRVAAALQELVEPPADAVTRFEDGAAWRVDAYFETVPAPDPSILAREVGALLEIEPPSLALEEVPAENWVSVSQAALPPVVAGRFTVHGSHDRHRIPRGPNTILIDAGEAFGTAHHATTAGCLMAITEVARRRRVETVLDLGCGSGVLAIAASRALPRARVFASDIDAIAIDVARRNARENGAQAIAMTVANGVPRMPFRRLAAPHGLYDLIVANILTGPLIELVPTILSALAPGGSLVLSGLLEAQAREVLGAYLPRRTKITSRRVIAGWSILTLRKR